MLKANYMSLLRAICDSNRLVSQIWMRLLQTMPDLWVTGHAKSDTILGYSWSSSPHVSTLWYCTMFWNISNGRVGIVKKSWSHFAFLSSCFLVFSLPPHSVLLALLLLLCYSQPSCLAQVRCKPRMATIFSWWASFVRLCAWHLLVLGVSCCGHWSFRVMLLC